MGGRRKGRRKRWSWERSGRSVSEMDGSDGIGVGGARPGDSRASEGRREVTCWVGWGDQEGSVANGIDQGVRRGRGVIEEGWR